MLKEELDQKKEF